MNGEETKIFLVEDDALLSKLLMKEIEQKGWKIETDEKGVEAFEKIKNSKPNVVLIDILLPGMDGMEILRQLKQDPETKNIPVLMLSNLSEMSKIERARDLGATKFLLKATSSMATIIADIEASISATRTSTPQ